MAKRRIKNQVRGTLQEPRGSRLTLDTSRPRETRQAMVPGFESSYLEKLRSARAVDLRNNATFESLAGGYVRVRAQDSTKRHG